MVSESQIYNEEQVDQKSGPNLQKMARLLFGIGVAGQWLFVSYIVAFYGGIVVTGAYEKVNEQLPHGIIEGDGMGNFMLAVHLALAAVVTFGGPLQFFKGIRSRFPVFHRWNGRIFFVTAFAGLYMIYTRGAHGGIVMGMGNTLNASLIFIFSALAWRAAMQRDFVLHKKWALRAFLMVNGVWFFRLGFGIWILITGFTAPGTSANLTGPFDIFLAFGHTLIPLAILEFYFYAKQQSGLRFQRLATAFFGLLALLLVGGIGMLVLVFWAPVL
ncbi:MAG: DUF2306 domain-containing protein [Phaeodactylibacter sp.]|nr:DUF2306 domain-containing protein [Phaeodactylibacter sp.]